MAIRLKPQQLPASTDERRINALIEKGGTVPAEATGDKTRPMLVQLRLSRDLIQRIDMSRRKRTVPPSRHSWILEALLEKLKADNEIIST
jgi:hypothetical protein